MSTSSRSRDAYKCKLAIIEAAEKLYAQKGSAVSINEIAKCAGYSKSGVLHHFPTREHLLAETAAHVNMKFDSHVRAYLDPNDHKPGRWIRAYIKALCQNSSEVSRFFRSSTLWLEFKNVPEINAAIERDNQLWITRFTSDGVDTDTAILITRAAEGIAISISQGDEKISNVQGVVNMLLKLSYCTEKAPFFKA